ncbi:MAG TPA: copper amine oxidase N-terminal domain-containing protein [Abditibacteriaceae bacterium]|jgi:hypothetical protein|nr:copper amine oxidase N-terminal domain-containing protein [Abditibacteriaceae bacterium]
MPYTLNGNTLNIAEEPNNKDGTLWVPLRAVSEALGAKVDWDQDNRVVIVYNGPYIYTVKIGDANVDADGVKVALQAAPFEQGGDSWVPVRFFERPMGYHVQADWQTKQVDITNPGAQSSGAQATSGDPYGDPAA